MTERLTSTCSHCGLQLNDGSALCPHHYKAAADNWSEYNRAYCNFFHRKQELPRAYDEEPAYEDRSSTFWGA